MLIFNRLNYTYIKEKESVEFICERCHHRKIAKKYAEYVNTTIRRRICNACYGNLLSKQKIG